MTRALTLYTRAGCGLCEEMEAALRDLEGRLRFRLETVDIDADPALVGRYNDRVPVLLGPDGAELCHYFLDEAAVSAALR